LQRLKVALAALALVGCGNNSGSQPEATSKGFPKRADGWWETSLGEAKQQYCVGNGSEEKYSLADALGFGDCSKRDFQRISDGWRFETVCSITEGHTTTQTGTITGDFRTSYRIVQQVVSDQLGTQKGEITARRLGDCPAGIKPGDQVSSGMTFNLLQ
jgi:hypothetical protein